MPKFLATETPSFSFEKYLILGSLNAKTFSWLLSVERQLPDLGQILLISHHPELLSNFSREDIFRFRRVSEGLIRAEAVPPPDPSGLTLYEEIARGWLDER